MTSTHCFLNLPHKACFDPLSPPWRWLRLLLALCIFQVAATTAAQDSQYLYSDDGNEVTDTRTGLVWRRCVEGMRWNGSTCIGSAASYSYTAALQLAASEAGRTGVAWRLPGLSELNAVARTMSMHPTIGSGTFPATPEMWFWSSSAFAGVADYSWLVFFGAGDDIRLQLDKVAVRLVRANPQNSKVVVANTDK